MRHAVRPQAGDEVLVHRLADSATVLGQAEAIKHALVASCPLRPAQPRLTLSPQGCPRFVDSGADPAPEPTRLPRGERAAATVAGTFLRRAEAAVREATAGAVNGLFPAALEHGTTRLCHSPRTGEPVHWLSTWALRLPARPSGRHDLAPVFGGTATVRVGADGRVIDVNSAVRPIVGRAAWPAYQLPSHHEHEEARHEGHDDEHDEAPPVLVYVAEGVDAPQRFLAPCYVDPGALRDPEHPAPGARPSGHAHGHLLPACEPALLPQVRVAQRRDRALVWAELPRDGGEQLVLGEGAGLRWSWGVATQAEFADGEIRPVDGAELTLPAPGLYHVELTVEHLGSEAIASTYTHVPVPGAVRLGPAPPGARLA